LLLKALDCRELVGFVKMMESDAQFWIMDEFAATLDRETAKIVAFNVQKLARQEGKAVLAATTHTDLL